MTRPIVMDIIARDNASKTFKQVANSQTQLAKQTDGLARGNDNLRKSELQLIAAQERYNKVAKDSGASVGRLASAQSSLIGAQQRVKKATDDAETSASKSKRSWSGAATAAAVAGVAVVGLGKSFVQAADDQRKANAQTAAVIKSTGGAAHVTAQQISDLTGALSKQTGIQDDTIQSGANMLLTFTNIRNEVGKGNDVFNQATKIVTDMSVALGEDMSKAAIQVGKALNDPIKGVTALQRVGVQFTQQQKDQIKVLVETGDTLGAQKIILQELNKEFGGSAAAQATAAGKMAAAWDNFKESAGNALLPVLDKVFGALTNGLDVFARYSGVLVPAVLALGGFAAGVWAINAASRAAAATSKALTIAFGEQRAAAVLASASTLGPLALIVAGTYGLSQALGAVTDKLPAYLQGFSLLSHSGDSYKKQVSNTVDLLQNQYVQALKSGTGGQKDLIDSTIAAGKSLTDIQIVVMDAGGDWGKYAEAVTGTDQQYKTYLDTVKAGATAHGADNDTIKQITGTLDKLRQAYVDGKLSAGDYAKAQDDLRGQMAATNGVTLDQQKFLDNNNLTIDQAKQKYKDAVAEAFSFTAQLGYMNQAIAELSGNNINATLQQDALNLAMGTADDNFAAARKQVEDHGTALKGNTQDAISNRDWAIQQIQAIETQAVTYATSTGSIKKGTTQLGINTEALKASMKAAGFTDQQIKDLITTYGATPQSIETAVKQKGQEAIVTKLGEMITMLERIADPAGWTAKVNLKFQELNTSMPLAASGGLIGGRGGPTEDNHVIGVSTGEFVVNAEATRKNLPVLAAMNNGMQKLAAGGLVGNLNGIVGNAGNGIVGNLTAAQLTALAMLNFSGAASIPSPGQLSGAVDTIAQRVADKMVKSGNVPGVSGPAPGNISALQKYAFSLFPLYGWGAGALSSLIDLWNGESGWNPNAVNQSSGAWGIPQSLPADKMASAGADWRTNGATQIRWGLQYINSVYGSPTNAYSAWLSRSPHWYGAGLGPTVFNRPTMLGVGERGPETVTVTPGRYGGGGVVVAPGAITVYAARGQDERQIAAQAFTMLRAWVAEEERRAAKGGRA